MRLSKVQKQSRASQKSKQLEATSKATSTAFSGGVGSGPARKHMLLASPPGLTSMKGLRPTAPTPTKTPTLFHKAEGSCKGLVNSDKAWNGLENHETDKLLGESRENLDTKESANQINVLGTHRVISKHMPQKEIQALSESTSVFTTVCIDSGAGGSVCLVNEFPGAPRVSADKAGRVYRAAGEQKLANVAEVKPRFASNGIHTSMTFQQTTGVKKPSAAATRITAKGKRVVLDEEGNPSYIENKRTCVKVPLFIENAVYMMEMLVNEETSNLPFPRPAR